MTTDASEPMLLAGAWPGLQEQESAKLGGLFPRAVQAAAATKQTGLPALPELHDGNDRRLEELANEANASRQNAGHSATEER
jgi:hypothetical protein